MRLMIFVSFIWVLYTFDSAGYGVQRMVFSNFAQCSESMFKLNNAGVITSVCTEQREV